MKILLNPKLFPTIMIVLDLVAAAAYASSQDLRRTIYWAAASVLTAAVTY